MGIFHVNAWLMNYGQFFLEIQTITDCTAAEAAWIATANYITLCFLCEYPVYLSYPQHRAVGRC